MIAKTIANITKSHPKPVFPILKNIMAPITERAELPILTKVIAFVIFLYNYNSYINFFVTGRRPAERSSQPKTL